MGSRLRAILVWAALAVAVDLARRIDEEELSITTTAARTLEQFDAVLGLLSS